MKWISVEDRLPKYSLPVLTYTKEITGERNRIIIPNVKCKVRVFPCGVTHWMPLPEPPKEVTQ